MLPSNSADGWLALARATQPRIHTFSIRSAFSIGAKRVVSLGRPSADRNHGRSAHGVAAAKKSAANAPARKARCRDRDMPEALARPASGTTLVFRRGATLAARRRVRPRGRGSGLRTLG